MTNTTWTITAVAQRPALGMRLSGGYATPVCAFADSTAFGGPTRERHADVAINRNLGTHAWSPPRR